MNNELALKLMNLVDTLVAYESNDDAYINNEVVVTCSLDMNRRIFRIHFNCGNTILDGGLDYISIDLGYFDYKVSAVIDNEVSNAWKIDENYNYADIEHAVIAAFHGMAGYYKNYK